MLDYRDISLMESVPLRWRTVTASPVGIEPMTILEGGGSPPPYNWYPIHNGKNSTFSTGWPPNTPYACAEARRTQVADATFRDYIHIIDVCLYTSLAEREKLGNSQLAEIFAEARNEDLANVARNFLIISDFSPGNSCKVVPHS